MKKYLKTTLRIAVALMVLYNLSMMSATAQQSIPRIISYQGQITAENKIPLSGNHTVSVAFYNNSDGTDMIWNGKYIVNAEGGIFNILLGSGAYPLPEKLDHAIYLGTSIDGGKELRPLSMLAAVPYALAIPDSSITSEKIAANYVGGIKLDGRPITTKGGTLNIKTGPGMLMSYDKPSNSMTLTSIGTETVGNANPTSANGGGGTVNTANTCVNKDGYVPSNQVSGGCSNEIYGLVGQTPPYIIDYSTIGGGEDNIITSQIPGQPTTEGTNWHTIGGGKENQILIDVNFASSSENHVMGSSTIAGGQENILSSPWGFIGGGRSNFIGNQNPVVDDDGGTLMKWNVLTGGWGNSIVTASLGSFIGGGIDNHIFGSGTSSSEEFTLIATANENTIGGGTGNSIQSVDDATIGGGAHNMIKTDANNSTIGGGNTNKINPGENSTISGGQFNTINDDNSAIAGGSRLTIGLRSFGFSGQSSSAQTDLSGSANIGVFNDVDLWLGNVSSSAKALRFYEANSSSTYSGANFTSIKAGAQAADITYTWPASIGTTPKNSILFLNDNIGQMEWLPAGTNGQVLTTSGTGGTQTLSWQTPVGGGGFLLKWYSESTATPIVSPTAIGIGAISHGENVVADADHSDIGGGEDNTIMVSGNHAMIGGGKTNLDSSAYAGIGGGRANTIGALNDYSVISGGDSNTISLGFFFTNEEEQVVRFAAPYSFIGGGLFNRINAGHSVICGGDSNLIDVDQFFSDYNFIGGGKRNIVEEGCFYNVVGGGFNNIQGGALSFIGSGDSNRIFDNCIRDVIAGGYKNFIGNQSHTPHGTSVSYATIGGGDTNTVNAGWGTIAGGHLNIINSSSTYSTIAGGDSNRIYEDAEHSIIGGGEYNVDSSAFASMVGGYHNTIGINSAYSFLGGGHLNAINTASYYSAISGGDSNRIYENAEHSIIGGGMRNIDSSAFAAMVGGYHNTIGLNSAYSVLGGGDTNTVASSHSGILGGYLNLITEDGNVSFIGGGCYNEAHSLNNTVPGGCRNKIFETSNYSSILGGSNNTIDHDNDHASIGGGYVNTIDPNSRTAVIAGGASNTVSAQSGTIGGGQLNTIFDNTVPDAGKFATIPGGRGLIAQSYGQTVMGVFNVAAGSSTESNFQGSTRKNDPILIVGNGDATTRSNAFEISNDGRSTVFKTNLDALVVGGNSPAILGSTYIDNVIYAWGYVDFDVPSTSWKLFQSFGAASVMKVPATTGVFVITINPTDARGIPVTLNEASITVTGVDNTAANGTGAVCTYATTSKIGVPLANQFIVRLYSGASGEGCSGIDHPFMFKLTGRP